MCTGARQRGRNGLRYYSPTGIPSHTAHRIEGRGKKGEQGSQRRLAHSAASDVAFTGASRESSGSGTLGVAVLGQGRSTQFSRPAPSHLAWYPRLSSIHRSQPLCSSEHPPKTPGPIGLSPPKNGRSGLVHPGTDDRQAAPSAEYYYTPRSHTYEQISPERHEYAFHLTAHTIPRTVRTRRTARAAAQDKDHRGGGSREAGGSGPAKKGRRRHTARSTTRNATSKNSSD